MDEKQEPPPYGPIPAEPPSYDQAVKECPLTGPFVIGNGPEFIPVIVSVGPNRTHMICPHCQSEIDTTTISNPGLIAYLAAAVICFMGCPFGCCLIPCCFEKCKNVDHLCPNCQEYLGTYRRV